METKWKQVDITVPSVIINPKPIWDKKIGVPNYRLPQLNPLYNVDWFCLPLFWDRYCTGVECAWGGKLVYIVPRMWCVIITVGYMHLNTKDGMKIDLNVSNLSFSIQSQRLQAVERLTEEEMLAYIEVRRSS